jgi:N-methylhydantoinase B
VSRLDQIDLEIIRSAFDTIAREMSFVLERTARSPIANETRDFSTSLLDPKGRLIAQGLGTPILMGTGKSTVEAILREFRFDLRGGDVILNNDPYAGGAHAPDTTLATPVFSSGKLLMIPAARSHLPDAGGGGTNPGGFNPRAIETCEESIRLPPLRIARGRAFKQDVYDWVIRNTRLPEWTKGDLEAMLGACWLAERRLEELIGKYGEAGLAEAGDHAIAYAERRFRDEIESWPDGEYIGETFLDSDGSYTRDIRLHVKVTIRGDELTLDWSGSSPQTKGFANSPIGNTWTHVYIALSSLVPESVPKNEGMFLPVTLITPLGSVVNPHEGAPVGYCTVHPGAEIGEAVMLALAQAIPEKVSGPLDKKVKMNLFGQDPRRRGKRYLSLNFVSSHGGASATHGQDGWGGLGTARGTMAFTTTEMTEVQYPHMVLAREFAADTAGPGRWRGGLGVTCDMTPVDHEAIVQATVWGGRHPSAGWCGGEKGRPNRIEIHVGRPDQVAVLGGDSLEMPLAPGDVVRVVRGGGGGWGEALERDPHLVREDVIDDYVSIDGARRDYGVVLDPDTLQVDAAATEAERVARRAPGRIMPPATAPSRRRTERKTIVREPNPAAQGGRRS